ARADTRIRARKKPGNARLFYCRSLDKTEGRIRDRQDPPLPYFRPRMRFAYPGHGVALRLVLQVGGKVGAPVMFPAPPLSRKEKGGRAPPMDYGLRTSTRTFTPGRLIRSSPFDHFAARPSTVVAPGCPSYGHCSTSPPGGRPASSATSSCSCPSARRSE